MSFLNPLGFLLLGLVPVVVMLYLRRVQRREAAVPTLLFWQRALGEQRHRAFLGRLRQWLSLLLHLLILLLLVLALTRPEPAGLALTGRSTVLVIDTRARMQALDAGGESRFSRFDAALAVARRNAAGAREGGSLAILTGGDGMRVVSPFSTDPDRLRERLAALAPTDAGGDLGPALALAGELLAARPGDRRILVLTDDAPLPSPALPEGVRLERLAFGTPGDNTAITRFAARPEAASPQTAALLLEVANYGAQRSEGSIEITLGERLLDVRPFALAPGERRSELFPALPAPADSGDAPDRLHARIAAPSRDALPLDDHAEAILPATPPLRVLLVSEGNWFFEKLLAADPALRFELLTPDAFEPSMARAFDVVIYDRCGPETLAAVEGNALFLKAGPLSAAGEALEQPLITDADPHAPLFRLVDWGAVELLRALPLSLPAATEGWRFETPLRSFEHPLIVTGEAEQRRMVIFAFDVAESDLPLRVAFPLLISNTLQWLAHREEGAAPASVETGSRRVLAPGETAYGPDGGVARGALVPLRQGVYRLDTPPEGTRLLAANLFNEGESNLRAAPAPEVKRAGTAPLMAVAATRPLWQWLVLAAFALLLLEWALYHRRETE